MLLTEEQKIVFARWLQLQISTSEGIVKQMETINAPAALLARERAEQVACKVVLRMITSGESMTIS
jgi:hypothetical protein